MTVATAWRRKHLLLHVRRDDDKSDEEDAPEPPTSTEAQPQFEREPILVQLFADAQNKKQEAEQQQVEEVEEDSGPDSDSVSGCKVVESLD